MKKVLTIVILFVTFLIIYILQANFFNWFTIAGIKPNLFIVLVLCIGLFAGQTVGTITGMVFGLLLDAFIGTRIGISGILLGIVGFSGGYLDKNFSKDSKLTIILMCLGATIFFEFMSYFLLVLIYQTEVELINLIRIVLIEAIYNSILIIIFYPVIQKAGYSMEQIFKGSNILTRYF